MAIDVGAAIYIALKPILKIYTIIFVGYLLAKYNIVTMEIARGISNMVVNAILPCLTFNKIVSNISWRDIKEIGVIILSAILLFSVGAFCSIVTKYTTPVPNKWFWGLLFAGIFPNISDLPIAYVQSMGNGTIFTEEEADKGVAYTCIFLFTQSFLMMNFGMWRVVGLDFRDKEHKNVSDNDYSDLEEGSNISKHESNKKPSFLKDHNEVTTEISHNSSGTEPDSGDERDITSIDSAAVDSDDDDNDDANANDKFDYIKPFEHGSSSRSGNARSNSTSSRIHPNLYQITSSPSLLESNDINRIYKRRNYARHSNELKHREKVNDVIAEYSAVNKMKSGELDLGRPLTLTEEIGASNTEIANILSDEEGSDSMGNVETSGSSVYIERIPTNASTCTVQGKMNKFIKKHHLRWVAYFVINFIRPASLGALLGIICALIPWVKACFVSTYVHVHKAPDNEPVLNFLMDFTGYIGNACVPLGLLLLGGTLARLQIGSLPKGFIKSAILMTVFRLIIIPIIGVLWANKLYDINWLETPISKFIMILTWAMPSATAQVYFTAFYTPIGGEHIQMDCLSIFFIIQYSILFITLSFVVTYTLKVEMHV